MEALTYRLKQAYYTDIAPRLKDKLGLKNVHQVPKLEKIVVSVGLGKQKEDKRAFEVAHNTLLKITGQKPVLTKARKSIASFKLRQGQNIGYKVTLRDKRMYEFLDRLINIVLPRVRDFHGVNDSAFDGSGNLNLGFKEQAVFPELTYEDTAYNHGVQVTLVISNAENGAKELLEAFGMPFTKKEAKDG